MIQKRVKGEPVQFPSPGEWVGDGSWWSFSEEAIPKQKIGGNITFFVWGFVCISIWVVVWKPLFWVFFFKFVPTMKRIRFPKFVWISTLLWLLLNWNQPNLHVAYGREYLFKGRNRNTPAWQVEPRYEPKFGVYHAPPYYLDTVLHRDHVPSDYISLENKPRNLTESFS